MQTPKYFCSKESSPLRFKPLLKYPLNISLLMYSFHFHKEYYKLKSRKKSKRLKRMMNNKLIFQGDDLCQ